MPTTTDSMLLNKYLFDCSNLPFLSSIFTLTIRTLDDDVDMSGVQGGKSDTSSTSVLPEVQWKYLGVSWKYDGSTWEYSGSTREV